MTIAPEKGLGNCAAWHCASYEADMMSYGKAEVPDHTRATIGLDIQDKCKEIDSCYFAQTLGHTAGSTVVAEGVQNA